MRNIKGLRRHFSEEFKRKRVKDYESGSFSVKQLSRMYHVSCTAIYKWIDKYSNFEKSKLVIVEKSNSSSERLKTYEKKIKELERIVGQKQIKIDYLEKLIEIAGSDLNIDLIKNFDTPHSNGLVNTEKK